MTIYKYALNGAINKVEIPGLHKVLDVQFQGSALCVWVIVDPQAEPETYLFTLVGTGWDFHDVLGEYIGTVQDYYDLVWHVFYTKWSEDERSTVHVS